MMIFARDLQWWGRRAMRRLGIPGTAAILLAVMAPLIQLAGVLPLQREIAGLRLQLTRLPVQHRQPVPVVTPEQSLTADLDAFRARFPTLAQLSDQLDTLFEITEKHGLTVDKGEYTLVEKSGGILRRFEVTMPVTGSYPQMRALILDVLDKLPAAAISDVTMERERIAEGRAKATLRLVFFVRKGA